jgi:hypothetical protein
MSAKGGEDPYLLEFLDHLVKKLKFFSVSWMPNRNSTEESKMIMRETLARMILAISGMDVNKYLQRWIEAASADPWLIETAFALVGHEAALRSGFPGLNHAFYNSLELRQRIEAFASIGKMMELGTGKIRTLDYDLAIEAAKRVLR